MANVIEKADKLVRTNVGVLERELVMPMLVTRNMGGSFVGAASDTIKVQIDSYLAGKRRTGGLRGTAALTATDLAETTVNVTLDVHAYEKVSITLAQLTLDIPDYTRQVAMPVTKAVGREIEDVLVETMEGATYAVSNLAISATDPWLNIVEARTALNKHRVPSGDRFLAVGADCEEALLKSDRISSLDVAGDSALREAIIGRVAGFTAVSVPGLDPKTMIAGHRSAFALGIQAPVVPRGAAGGATSSYNGLAMTAIFDYDEANANDQMGMHSFCGASVVTDGGTIDAGGNFLPDNTASKILVRAVKLALV